MPDSTMNRDRVEAMIRELREDAKEARECRGEAPNFADDYRRGMMVGRAYLADRVDAAANLLESMIRLDTKVEGR